MCYIVHSHQYVCCHPPPISRRFLQNKPLQNLVQFNLGKQNITCIHPSEPQWLMTAARVTAWVNKIYRATCMAAFEEHYSLLARHHVCQNHHLHNTTNGTIKKNCLTSNGCHKYHLCSASPISFLESLNLPSCYFIYTLLSWGQWWWHI